MGRQAYQHHQVFRDDGGERSLEEVFQVDAYVASYKVDTAEGHARRLFVQKVYSVLSIALVITIFSGLLSLVLAQQFAVATFYGAPLEQGRRAELINIIVAISLCLTILNWCAASYLGLRLLQQLDLTVLLLLCWAAQLIWFFLFLGLWLFASSSSSTATAWRWVVISWDLLGLLLYLLQLAIHTQMVSGGGGGDFGGEFGGGSGNEVQQKKKKKKKKKRLIQKFIFTSNHLLLATVSLYLDSVLLFALLTPLTGALVSALQQVTEEADLLPQQRASF